jgi:hypothetical protein
MIMSSYEQKIESARSIFEQHNLNVDEADKLDFDIFLKNLRKAGGTTEAALKLCKWEDIEKWGAINNPIPCLIARQISQIFRQQKDKRSKVITYKKSLVMNMRELLEVYDPRESNAVYERLAHLAKDLPCIVFNEDSSINVDASVECLNDIREGHLEPRDVYILNGIPQKVHYVGSKPNSVVDENPLIPGSALRGADQVCNKTYRSWKDVPHKARILCCLALETKELKITQVGDIHSTLNLFVDKIGDEATKVVAQRFPQASLVYKELELQGNLPTLKLVRGKLSAKKQDPFYGGHKVF